MANDRLLEKTIDPVTGVESLRWYTSAELIAMGTDAPEYIAQLRAREQAGN
jgi:hypothetical protein